MADIRHDDGFIVLRHPAGESLPHLDAHVLQRLRAFSRRDLEIEFLLVDVHQQERPGVRAQNLVDLFHDGAQDLIELQRRGEGLAQLVEDRDFGDFQGFRRGYARTPAPFDATKGLRVSSSSDRVSRETRNRVWGLVGQHLHYSERFSRTAMGIARRLT